MGIDIPAPDSSLAREALDADGPGEDTRSRGEECQCRNLMIPRKTRCSTLLRSPTPLRHIPNSEDDEDGFAAGNVRAPKQVRKADSVYPAISVEVCELPILHRPFQLEDSCLPQDYYVFHTLWSSHGRRCVKSPISGLSKLYFLNTSPSMLGYLTVLLQVKALSFT